MTAIALPQDATAARAPWLTPWQVWGMIFVTPYVLVFLAFVLYPVGYGLWLARHPYSYAELYEDPVFLGAIVNTLIFLIVGINIKMVFALLM